MNYATLDTCVHQQIVLYWGCADHQQVAPFWGCADSRNSRKIKKIPKLPQVLEALDGSLESYPMLPWIFHPLSLELILSSIVDLKPRFVDG